MNYMFREGISYDVVNDGMVQASDLGVDRNGDGVNEDYLLIYSQNKCADLNESSLSQSDQIQGALGSEITFLPMTNGSLQPIIADGSPINWSSFSPDLNSNNSSGDVLTGFDDYDFLQNVKLSNKLSPDLSFKEFRALQRRTVRINQLGKKEFDANANGVKKLNFDNLAVGEVVSAQYSPDAVFASDALHHCTVEGPLQRMGMPTSSPKLSLVSQTRKGAPADLIVRFPRGQRYVGLYVGWEGNAIGSDAYAELTAYDRHDIPMGMAKEDLLSHKDGIMQFIGIGAVFVECPGFLYQGYEGMGWVMGSEHSSAVCCWNEGSVATVVEAVHCDANAEGVW